MHDQSVANHAIAAQLRSVQRELRRRRRVRLGVRAVWLALLVWCAGLVLLLLGVQVPMIVLVGASLMTLAAGTLYAWFSQPSVDQLTHGLDRFYHLSEQTATALELAQRGPANEIEQRLLNEASAWLAGLRHYVLRLPLMPWREAETLMAVALVALGLTVALGPATPEPQPPLTISDLPAPAAPTPTALPELDPLPTGDQPGSQLGPEARAAADALGDALSDNGATRSAADALRRGDLASAARALRELADGASQLSEQARQEIAEGLRQAVERLREHQPGLAEQLEQLASALEQGGQQAEQALEELARTVEQLGQPQDQLAQGATPEDFQAEPGATNGSEPQGSGEPGAGQQGGGGIGSLPGSETRSTAPEAAAAQGDDLPLPTNEDANGATTQAQGPRGPMIEIEAGGTGNGSNSRRSNSFNQPLKAAADPLTIPLEYRDVVENYFTPAR